MATSGKAWREKTTTEYTFSTGNVAKLRKPDLIKAISSEGLPDVFMSIIQKVDFSKETMADSEIMAVLQEIPALWKYVDQLVIAAFVEPRIVDNPRADDEIAIDDVDLVEKIEAFTWIMKGVTPLIELGKSFLRK